MGNPKKRNQNLVKIARLQFAEFLRSKRIEAQLSQLDAAKALKLKNAQFISNVERGLAPFPFKALKVLMKLYKISFEELSEKYLYLQKSLLKAAIFPDAENKK